MTADLLQPTAIRTVFIADDDTDDLMLLQDAIASIDQSIKLQQVDNGNDLLSLLGHFQPDLLFLDLDMPGKNGLQCLVEIRKNPLYHFLPIIVYSSTTRPANIETAYDMGADLFFIKPAIFNDLVSSVRSLFTLDWSQPAKVKEHYFVNGRFIPFQ
ncbi:MAG: response regulator [Flavisolibacter sp.]|jgi:CheY-like chemotaxis protein